MNSCSISLNNLFNEMIKYPIQSFVIFKIFFNLNSNLHFYKKHVSQLKEPCQFGIIDSILVHNLITNIHILI
ncbi:hypothetical protein AXG55_13475 [Silvanigrella aquatica]|uniref:Uncharacterized protein n=1 Tax=Silvanigrella aquatica TaxID=1915309 RepID=A0A1L4D3S4_9BACT|nr:hypothetical protein AXG55_13475 [Silvanigrella aquatica]